MVVKFVIITERDNFNFILTWFGQIMESMTISYIIKAKNEICPMKKEDRKEVL